MRPLPSRNGWIVSNCACAIAACSVDRQVVEVQERGEVFEQLLDVLVGGRDEVGAGGAEPRAADPVLLAPDDAAPARASRVPSNSVPVDRRRCRRASAAAARSPARSRAPSRARCRSSAGPSRRAPRRPRPRARAAAARRSGSRSATSRPTPGAAAGARARRAADAGRLPVEVAHLGVGFGDQRRGRGRQRRVPVDDRIRDEAFDLLRHAVPPARAVIDRRSPDPRVRSVRAKVGKSRPLPNLTHKGWKATIAFQPWPRLSSRRRRRRRRARATRCRPAPTAACHVPTSSEALALHVALLAVRREAVERAGPCTSPGGGRRGA